MVEQIQALERELRAGEGEKDKLGRQLRDIETEIGQLGRQLRELDRDIGQQATQLAALNEEQAALRTKLGEQSTALGRQLRSAYLLGREHRLKLLFNLEDPSAASRTLGYYNYFNRAREALIDQFADELAEARRISRAINTRQQALEASRDQLAEKQQQQQRALTQRRQLLSGLIDRLDERRGHLTTLNADQAQLTELLEQLRDIFADIPETLDQQAPAFASLRGTLRWPTVGELSEPPGRDKPGGLARNGAVIKATAGSDVIALAHGRVAFADWLRGFGLLLIIDHGEGYMSLYGFNDALYNDVGDWVSPGDTIAAVGNSGGRLDSGLYFELRVNGKPVDPRRWLTSNMTER